MESSHRQKTVDLHRHHPGDPSLGACLLTGGFGAMRANMNKGKLVVSRKGVKIYHSWKGAQAQTFWYALTPNHQAEGGGQDFDVRRLPEAYRQGLEVEVHNNPADPEAWLQKSERMFQAHKEAIRRAIDGGHDFLTDKRPATVRFWRQMKRLLRPDRQS
jgi:hypothetical protein